MQNPFQLEWVEINQSKYEVAFSPPEDALFSASQHITISYKKGFNKLVMQVQRLYDRPTSEYKDDTSQVDSVNDFI